MDLFNPPKLFNYKKMDSRIELETLENPYVQIVWEDTPENVTQEKIKSVKQYFQKKYNTTNVNVITKVRNVDETSTQSVDVSTNIMDKNYQVELVKSHLRSKGYDEHIEKVLELDSAVENRILSTSEEVGSFKKWYIKKIEFSNFLSYGEDQVLDFEKCNGITVIESNPPNFGGKTVLTVDLLMFLFFNTTTKTNKAEEIFNRFTKRDRVIVRGEITIDGDDYIIARGIERKKSKSGEWNVKTELDFFKKLPNGELQNFTGEQRRETEAFIKNSIGEQEDFLMTILTTATNLEDLLEAKPTARGQVLSKFLGLEFLKKKEETGKELYSEFSRGMISNVYNTEKLKQDNDNLEQQNITLQGQIDESKTKLVEVNGRIVKGVEYRDELVKSKFGDLDHELVILNPEQLDSQLETLKREKVKIQNDINSVNVVEPTSYYHEDEHDKIKEEYNINYKEKIQLDSKISDIESLKSSVNNGIKCEHCGIELMNAAITQEKISQLAGFITHRDTISSLMNELSGKEKGFVDLKKQFDEYERNKLIKEKYEVSLESNELRIENLINKQKRYFDVQEKIKKNKDIEEKIIKADMRLNDLYSEQKNYEKVQNVNNLSIQNNVNQIKKNNEMIQKISDEFKRERVYKMYQEVFGKNGISKMIMKTMMPIINSELQRLLQDSCYFNLEIRISDKNEVEFVMIDNNTGVEKLMTSGSGYEKTIASLALRSVLSKICSLPKPNVIVMDEVFGKISNDNLEMVYEFFIKIKEYFEKIFVITHNPMISNWADNIVKITKTDNISMVKQ
jgi:DNA repair exonuclease SbcCD ATPase subunit